MFRYSIALVAAMLLQSQSDNLQLTPEEEKDSYEIYSLLLKQEMPASWKITGWQIERETRTFFSPGQACLPSGSPSSLYQTIVDDYSKRNQQKLLLERKFDLPQYWVLDAGEVRALQEMQKAGVIFHVSAVGFSADRTRALVYAGHYCGRPLWRWHLSLASKER